MKKYLSMLIIPGFLGLFLFTGIPGVEAEVKVTSKGNYNKPGSSYHTTAIREHVHLYQDADTHAIMEHNKAGVKADAPNLVRFTKDLTLGVEGGKDIVHDIFYPDDYGYYEADRGYFGYLKVTYTGTLFDLSKDD